MPALLVDVPSSSAGTPIGFGSLPGFALSQSAYQASKNSFGSGTTGTTFRFAAFEVGIGDVLREAFNCGNFADTGNLGIAVGAGAHGAELAVRPVVGNPAFAADNTGSLGSPTGRGDDGIACYDAAPTSGDRYSALYFGNDVDTVVGQLTLGQQAPAPSFRAGGAAGQTAAAGQTVSFALNAVEGVLNVVAFERHQSTLNDLPTVGGWTKVFSPTDGTPPGDQTTSLTLYYRRWRRGDVALFTVTFPTAFTGGYAQSSWDNVRAVTPVLSSSVAATDTTNATAPGVTTSTFNNTVVAIVSKLAATGGSGFAAPAGWTLNQNQNQGDAVGSDSHWIAVASKSYAAGGTATGSIAFTGASSSFGAAVTLLLSHGDGLTSAATSGNVSYEGLGFTPELLLFITSDPVPGQAQGTLFQYGAADASLNQWVASSTSAWGSGPTGLGGTYNQVRRWSRFHNDAVISHIGAIQFGGTTTNDVVASLASVDADGFTLNITTMTGGTTARVYFLAVRGTGSTSFAVGNSSARASTGTQTVTAPGFRPDAVVVGSCQTTVSGSLNTAHGTAVFGMTDGVTQRGHWNQGVEGALGASPTSSPSQWWGDAMLPFADAPTTTMLARANLLSLTGSGFSLDWTVADGNQYLYGWIALKTSTTVTPKPVAVTLQPSILPGTNFYRLRGAVTPNTVPGDRVSWFFEWGATTAYGNATTTTSDGDGTTTTTVTKDVATGLSVFHYRLVIVTADGCRINGNDVLFQLADLVFGNRFRVKT